MVAMPALQYLLTYLSTYRSRDLPVDRNQSSIAVRVTDKRRDAGVALVKAVVFKRNSHVLTERMVRSGHTSDAVTAKRGGEEWEWCDTLEDRICCARRQGPSARCLPPS